MSAKPHTTLLLAGASELLRADFPAPGALPVSVTRRPRQAEHGLAEAARHALALGGVCGKNVWVASDDMWSQVLSLPLAAARNLSGNELSAALAFEAEPLSGIASTNAAIGQVAAASESDNLRSFAVITCELPARDALQKLLADGGSNLRGMASLADLPPNTSAATQEQWLKSCLDKLSATPPTLPLIQPKPRDVSPLRFYLVGAAMLALAIGGVIFHTQWVNFELNMAEGEIQRLRQPQQQLQMLRKKMHTDRAELQKLQDENAKRAELLKNIDTLTAQLRTRVPAILSGVKNDRPSDVAILGMTSEGSGVLKLDGLSLDAARADLFVTQLDTALKPFGLNALPFSKEAQGIAADGGPWKFSMQLQPIPPKSSGNASDTNARKIANQDGRDQ